MFTLGIAKRVCTMYENNNQRDYLHERNYNDYRISKGYEGKDWFIYELERYEPFEIEYSHLKLILTMFKDCRSRH